MFAGRNRTFYGINDLRASLLVTKREVRDAFRDWRIIIPIVVLTLGFPLLASFTARLIISFTETFGAELVGDRLIPFLLLVIGFFPMSFSLVIALETFVGEKERKSLEPLLATPLTNSQLYVGKVLAAIVPPLSTSFLGIVVYVIGLTFITQWHVSFLLFVQILLLTTIQGIIMAAAAVIVSGQTTTVRAANLLASFIIIPVALLLQFEAIVFFWGNSRGLWMLIVALAMTAFILIRMGISIFNREALLGQDFDQLRIGFLWRAFKCQLLGKRSTSDKFSLIGWIRSLSPVKTELRYPSWMLFLSIPGGLLLGYILFSIFPAPQELSTSIRTENFASNMNYLGEVSSQLSGMIFWQNLRVVVLGAVLGIFTLGVTDVILFLLPWTLIGYLATLVAATGANPLVFTGAVLIPHAFFEVPALLIAGSAALRWHITIMSPQTQRSLSENWIIAFADYLRLLFVFVIPLLLVASYVEAYVTPKIVLWLYGS